MRLPHHVLLYAPGALLLSWEQKIDPDISMSVHAYARSILMHPAVIECVPAYASLLVRFQAPKISPYALKEYIFDLTPAPPPPRQRLRHEIAVYYNGPDLVKVASTLQLSVQRVIELHCSQDYLVYQLGYQPGFAFLGETPPDLAIARRPSPRAQVSAGAVGIAGRQTGIYPVASPGGWQLLGHCPIPLLRPGPDPTRFRAGDTVRFYPIESTTFTELQQSPTPWPER